MPNNVNSVSRPVRAVAFDAVGTLIYPQPSVAEAYRVAIERHCGMEIDAEVVRQSISRALASRSSSENLQTDEAAESEFWADLVKQLCPDESGFQACFEDLFTHFSLGENWRCFPEVQTVLEQLAQLNVPLAIASNFDSRLNQVCDELPELAILSHRIISSLVGWRKPAAQFFKALSDELDVCPEEILFVGDDPTNDVQGALNAGMQAALIARGDDSTESTGEYLVLSDLSELLCLFSPANHDACGD